MADGFQLTDLASPATNGDSPTRGQGPSVHPVQWKTKRKALFGGFLSVLMLSGWLAAALLLWNRALFLPLNYFNDIGGVQILANGGYKCVAQHVFASRVFGWSMISKLTCLSILRVPYISANARAIPGPGLYPFDSISTLITWAGTILSAFVGYCFGQGVLAILRYQFLRGDRGVSVYWYEALVKIGQGALQTKWRGTAILALTVFACIQLLNTATQAAFGSSVAKTNISVPLHVARISDNVNYFSNNLPILAQVLAISGDADANVLYGALISNPGSNETSWVIVYYVQELSNHDTPLFAPIWQFATSLQAFPSASTSPFSPAQSRLLGDSTETLVASSAEGFSANASCTALTNLSATHVFRNSSQTVEFAIDFGCELRVVIYSLLHNDIVDTFACEDGTPYVFIFGASPAVGNITFAYRCAVSAQSALFPTVFEPHARSASLNGPPTDVKKLPNSLGLVTLLGLGLLNNFGARGWPVLALALQVVDASGFDRLKFITYTIEMLAKTSLAGVSGSFAVLAYNNDTRLEYTPYMDSQLEVRALKVHLRGSQVAWICVPLTLLLLVLGTTFFATLKDSGDVDFMDPVSTTLIGLGSPSDPVAWGACTGHYFDGKSHNTAKYFKRNPHQVRLAYGEPLRSETAVHYPEAVSHLAITASPMPGLFQRPKDGNEYI